MTDRSATCGYLPRTEAPPPYWLLLKPVTVQLIRFSACRTCWQE